MLIKTKSEINSPIVRAKLTMKKKHLLLSAVLISLIHLNCGGILHNLHQATSQDDWVQNSRNRATADSIAQENQIREQEKNRQQLMATAEIDIKNTDYVGAINIYRQIQSGVSNGLYPDFQMDSLLKNPQLITSKIGKCKLAFRQLNASRISKVDSINSEWTLVVQSFDSMVVANKLFLISGVVKDIRSDTVQIWGTAKPCRYTGENEEKGGFEEMQIGEMENIPGAMPTTDNILLLKFKPEIYKLSGNAVIGSRIFLGGYCYKERQAGLNAFNGLVSIWVYKPFPKLETSCKVFVNKKTELADLKSTLFKSMGISDNTEYKSILSSDEQTNQN